jgi:tetratricopeptide (TPR) repeat protein
LRLENWLEEDRHAKLGISRLLYIFIAQHFTHTYMISKKNFLLTLCFTLGIVMAYGQTPDNAELAKMYQEDQQARSVSNINWPVLSRQDSLREVRVYELIREGKIITGKDYYNSAMIFQHGRDSVASGMAVEHMRKAIKLDTTVNRWLLAAAIDRDLMRRNKPQIYGTQFVKFGANAKWERYKMDSTQVTDEQRRYYRVETLAEQRLKERRMNLKALSEQYQQAKPIAAMLAFIRGEVKKGDSSEFDVSEAGINSFGYEVLASGKMEEALSVFKLNTELYPSGFNTWDSLGECLLKVGRKNEALAAYRKSLQLNPANESAKKVLAENR